MSRAGLPWTENNLHERPDAVQGPFAAIDVERRNGLPARKGRGQPSQAQDMVQVAVGEKDPVQPAETQAAPQQLALRALAAVDQEAMVLVQHHRRRQAAVNGWRRGRSPEKDQLEQGNLLTGVTVPPSSGGTVSTVGMIIAQPGHLANHSRRAAGRDLTNIQRGL